MTPQRVSDQLGDKIITGFSSIVVGAAADLAEYRRLMPAAARRASERGLANWIHDAMRARALAEFDDFGQVTFTEREPHFDVHIQASDHTHFRIRLKRHNATGNIANYRTQGALDFVTQPEDLLSLLGINTVHLAVGYEWDPQTRAMKGPIMTLRDGSFEDVVWMVDLPARPAAELGTVVTPVTPITPTIESPTLPTIEVHGDDEARDSEGNAAE